MSNILFKMKDGTERRFDHKERAGGSYTKTLSIEGGCAVVTDEYYERTLIPLDLIAEIKESPTRW